MGKRETTDAFSLLATASVAGLGLAAGRGTWGLLKRNSGTLVFLMALLGVAVGPFLGFREMVRGHDRGSVGTLLRTVLGSMSLIAVGLCLGVAITGLFGFLIGSPEGLVAFGAVMAALAFVGALVGLLVGIFQRPARKRRFEVVRRNVEFLKRQSFRETGGSDITHYDGDGNALRLLEKHADRLVFMVVGKRGKRSYIDLADDGVMQRYSGV